MKEMDIQQKLVAHADDPSNHQALLKLLEHKGVISGPEDWAFYHTERKACSEHIVRLGSVLSLAMLAVTGKTEELERIAGEMGFTDMKQTKLKCLEALDYLYMSDTDRAAAKKLLDQIIE
ncbi:MAG: hypothetical protein GWN58_32885 [Anaerolineae bacterium]|nr:hypothetical protein [Thermoplasmata archaeon]NIV34071.1 hypothetical protein [Anaerolineae bacterium]NIY05922.1 hypothetical protein [Thermoplasmata archaeon]